MRYRSTLARVGATTAAATVLALASMAPASAHVTVAASQTAAGSYTVLTFSVPHGCEGSPTTSIVVQIPEAITAVTPTRSPFYDISVKTEKLTPPITGEGGEQITERTSTVIYTATTPLPADQRDTFELSLQLPDTPGKTLAFPTIQKCEQGQTAWTEVPATGETAEDREHPAPAFEVTTPNSANPDDSAAPPTSPTATTDQPDAENAETAGTAGTAGQDSNTSSNGLAVAGLIAGVLGLIAGGAALARTGRHK